MDYTRNFFSVVCLFLVFSCSCVSLAAASDENNTLSDMISPELKNKLVSQNPVNPQPVPNEADEPFIKMLQDGGFTVQQGTIEKVDFIRLAELGIFPDAEGNNAANPYFCYVMPPAPDQTIESDKAFPNGFSRSIRIMPDEAVVMIGQTPPECKFFSYPTDITYRTFDGVRTWIFGGIGDTINIGTINAGDGNGEVFDQPVMIIYSPDNSVAEKVKSLAISAGYPETMINIAQIPPPQLNLGLEEDDDAVAFGMRAAVFADPDAEEKYMKDVYTVTRAYRLTPDGTATPDPFPVSNLRVRGTGESEFYLYHPVQKLRQAIIDAYPDYTWEELDTDILFPETNQQIQNAKNAVGENRDASYLGSENFTLGMDQFAISYGVNHMATGKGVYSNVNAYGTKMLNGVCSIDSTKFDGSVERYLGDDPDYPMLYAITITRNNSTEPFTMIVPEGPNLYGIPLEDEMLIGWRTYMEPGTNVGPAYPELLFDKVIMFTPK